MRQSVTAKRQSVEETLERSSGTGVTFELRRKGEKTPALRGGVLGRGDSQCKGPEAAACVACFQNSESLGDNAKGRSGEGKMWQGARKVAMEFESIETTANRTLARSGDQRVLVSLSELPSGLCYGRSSGQALGQSRGQPPARGSAFPRSPGTFQRSSVGPHPESPAGLQRPASVWAEPARASLTADGSPAPPCRLTTCTSKWQCSWHIRFLWP